jgi:DNA ligase-1
MPEPAAGKQQRTLASFFAPKNKKAPAPEEKKQEDTTVESGALDKMEEVEETEEVLPPTAGRKRRNIVESDSEDEHVEGAAPMVVDKPAEPAEAAKEVVNEIKPASAAKVAAPKEKAPKVAAPKEEAPKAAAAPAEKKKAPAGGMFSLFSKPAKKAKTEQPAASASGTTTAAGRGRPAGFNPEKKAAAPPAKAALIASRLSAASASATTPAGEPLPYQQLSKCLDDIGSTTKRLEITKVACDFIRGVLKTSPSSALQCLYLCINKLGPDHDNIELGVGDSLLIKAIAQASGRNVAKVKTDYENEGDLGEQKRSLP